MKRLVPDVGDAHGLERAGKIARRRVFLASFVLMLGVVALGTFLSGPDFIVTPLPINQWWANFWLTFNGVLAFVTLGSVYRNLLLFEDDWTWQEISIIRGICWVLAGSAIGYITRVYTHSGSVTLGTPAITLGMLALLYGTLRTPVRFEESNGSPS